ncbi:MAG TPA: MFS transporter [Nocardioidaceae bacterium]|nr:MFS transporter [Nocardioidaceae bacterium]
MTAGAGSTTVRYRDLFRDREFSGMWFADVLSMAGSYLARLAVAALVYGRTGSPGLTATAFAISFAPYLFAPVLATIADRFPRKELLVATDVVRSLLILLLVIPGMPLPLLLVTLFAIEVFQIPFGAARLATLADVLDDDRFPAGNALVAGTRQALQVGGFVIGGAVVAATNPYVALMINSLTYVSSAVLILLFVQRRPQPWAEGGERPAMWAGTREGLRFVARTPGMPIWFALLALGPGIVIVAEGLAVPYADQLEGGTRLAGVIMATAPLGNVVGLALLGRLPLERQRRLIFPGAIGCGLLVGLSGLAGRLTDSPFAVIVLLTASGVSLAYLAAIQALVARMIPSAARGRVFGLGNAVIQIAQGGAVALAGALAEGTEIAVVLTILGAVAVVLGLLLAVPGRRAIAQPL